MDQSSLSRARLPEIKSSRPVRPVLRNRAFQLVQDARDHHSNTYSHWVGEPLPSLSSVASSASPVVSSPAPLILIAPSPSPVAPSPMTILSSPTPAGPSPMTILPSPAPVGPSPMTILPSPVTVENKLSPVPCRARMFQSVKTTEESSIPRLPTINGSSLL